MYLMDVTSLYLLGVSFKKSAYTVDEDDGPLQLTLVRNTELSADFTIQVLNNDNTALGK